MLLTTAVATAIGVCMPAADRIPAVVAQSEAFVTSAIGDAVGKLRQVQQFGVRIVSAPGHRDDAVKPR